MKSKNGFTFIEFIISLGIFAMVVIIILGVYINVTRVVVENQAQIELNQDGQIILNSMIKDIRRCEVAYQLYKPGGIPSGTKVVNFLLLKETSDATSTVNYIAYRSCTSQGVAQIQKCYETDNTCDLDESCDEESEFKTLTAPFITADRLDFHINPNYNPFVETLGKKKAHPRITTVIKLRSIRSTKKPHELILQQTDYQKADY